MKLSKTDIIFANLIVLMLLLIAGCHSSNPIGEYQSMKDLYANCPGDCGEVLPCEGQEVMVWGYLDIHNIFDAAQGNEVARFLIAENLDAQGFGDGKVIEIRLPETEDLSNLFNQLNNAPGNQKVFVTGIVGSFDAPTNLTCRKMMTISIQNIDQVSFE